MSVRAIIYSPSEGQFLQFDQPGEILLALQPGEVSSVLARAEESSLKGNWVVGFVSYEAARAFEPGLKLRQDNEFPLAQFAIYPSSKVWMSKDPRETSNLSWFPDTTQSEYLNLVQEVKKNLLRGDSYQVNLSLRLKSSFDGEAEDLFCNILSKQKTEFSALIETDSFAICSFSPELFFKTEGSKIISRPMKGTAPRGKNDLEDIRNKNELQNSHKNRAENVMIVDMIRNDLSRVAEDVHVTSLCQVEEYPSLFQMTSEVTGRLNTNLHGVFESLFPCASITGAPKHSTINIIDKLEKSPRRLYTGAVGFIRPGGDSQFNVAIRTVLIDKIRNLAEYGVGSGITWDSEPTSEYNECILKSRVVNPEETEPMLLESIGWQKDCGLMFLEPHLKRLEKSADQLGYKFDRSKIILAINSAIQGLPEKLHKIRITVTRAGDINAEASKVIPRKLPLRIGLSSTAVNSNNPLLYYKTTNRSVYEKAMKGCLDCDDVLLWNQNGEITESTIANIAFKFGNRWYTPPISCGLLPGVFRSQLIGEGKLQERILLLEELKLVEQFALLNSVRLWEEAELVSQSSEVPLSYTCAP